MKCCFLFRFLFIRAKFKSTENSSCGSRWVERSIAFSLRNGMCSSTDTRVLRKGGGHLAKSATLPAVFQAPVRPGIVNLVHSNFRRSNKLLSVAQQLIKPSGYRRGHGSREQRAVCLFLAMSPTPPHTPHLHPSMWELSSLTRDRTHAPCTGAES